MDCTLILANGSWDDDGVLLELVAKADRIIAADGAWDQAVKRGIHVDAVVGDFDSSQLDPDALDGEPPTLLRYPADKDWTDLELALDYALKHAAPEVLVYGALGGRIDHMLGNLSLLEKGVEHNVRVCLVSGRQSVRLIDAYLRIEAAHIGDIVSLVPVSQTVRLTTQGLRYPLTRERLQRGSTRGISNVVDALPAGVDVHEGRLYVIHEKAVHDA